MRKYRLVAKKGEGTFSEVLKAQNVKDGKYYAIKCMKNRFDSIDQVNDYTCELKFCEVQVSEADFPVPKKSEKGQLHTTKYKYLNTSKSADIYVRKSCLPDRYQVSCTEFNTSSIIDL